MVLRTRSFGSVEITALDRTAVIDGLRDAAASILSRHPEVEEVRLFGSIARGDCTADSDADLLVILRGARAYDPLEAGREYYRHIRLPIRVELLVISHADLDRCLAEKDPFFCQVMAESMTL